MQRKSESGRSMVEIIGVLAIGALLTSGAVVLIQNGMASQKVSRVGDEINALVSAARLATMETGDYSKFGSPVVSSDGFSGNPPSRGGPQSTRAKRLLKMSENVTPFGSDSYYAVTGDGDNLTIWVIGLDNDYCSLLERRTFSGASYAKCQIRSDVKYNFFTVNYNE